LHSSPFAFDLTLFFYAALFTRPRLLPFLFTLCGALLLTYGLLPADEMNEENAPITQLPPLPFLPSPGHDGVEAPRKRARGDDGGGGRNDGDADGSSSYASSAPGLANQISFESRVPLSLPLGNAQWTMQVEPLGIAAAAGVDEVPSDMSQHAEQMAGNEEEERCEREAREKQQGRARRVSGRAQVTEGASIAGEGDHERRASRRKLRQVNAQKRS
jgi:hypothetical protein